MASLAELARQHTDLTAADVAHLQRLVAEWGLLADLCFADLLLFVPLRHGGYEAVAQVRPVTSQTLHVEDLVGERVGGDERPHLDEVLRTGEVVEGELPAAEPERRAKVMAIPVRHDGRVVAVLTREWSPMHGRHPGELERVYLDVFGRFARMITAGLFPFPAERAATQQAPRVGDGVLLLDASARVEYASPNAVSALHRVGIQANAVGLRLGELGFNDQPVRAAFETMVPVTEEVEQTTEVTLILRCIPLLSDRGPTGCIVVLRDISELRRRDRMLLSKDATIREIHHRVKNNLQTISSLLRLQGRRLSSGEAKAAINESVRRIRTIALVHETLSRETGDDVAFMEIVRPLTRLAEESLQSPDRPVRFRVEGDGGKLLATVATPLAVVLTELLQNAVDHAFPGPVDPAQEVDRTVVVALANDGDRLCVRVMDNGVGLPEGFELEQATGLGLSIVRTLVTTELDGTITMRPREGGGTVVELELPTRPHQR